MRDFERELFERLPAVGPGLTAFAGQRQVQRSESPLPERAARRKNGFPLALKKFFHICDSSV
jgi:hypothetical protein